MKTIYKAIFIFSVALFAQNVTAQKATISGTVTDSQSPLPGATIILSNNQKATTDFSGYFTIQDVRSGSLELQIAYIGYETKNIKVEVKDNQRVSLGIIRLETNSKELSEVVVSGMSQRNSEARALNMQKKSMSIVNVIAADGIGKLPDRNAAETVQRMPGVSIERDQGEGRFVSVRGLPPFWSSTTINGNRIPTAEEETTSRATAFDFFPSDLIAYVEATKALTPDMDGDAIGGSVNFTTQTAPTKRTIKASIFSGYNQKSDKGIYSGSLTIGDKSKNGKFGYIINGTYWDRNWATDNYEARRNGDQGVYRLELRDYTGIRKTTGLNAAMEFNPSSRDKIFLKATYGGLSDTETHYKHRIRFDKFNSTTNALTVEQQDIHNELMTQFLGLDLGGKHQLANGTLDWSLASYRNRFKYGNIPNAEDNSYFLIQFNQTGVGVKPEYLNTVPVASGGAGGPRAYWAADGGKLDPNNPKSIFDFYSDPNFKTDPTKMKFSTLELYKISIVERDNIIAAVNYEHNFNESLKMKFGAKLTDKDRIATFRDEYYNWTGSPTPFLSNYGSDLINQPGGTDYMRRETGTNIGNTFGPVLSGNGMNNLYNSAQGSLVLNPTDSQIPELGKGLGRNFNVGETTSSGYAMATYSISDKWTVLGGVRVTNTITQVTGKTVENNVVVDAENTKTYTSVLPMLHVKYTPIENLNLRFATTRTFARPNFGDISPAGSLNTIDGEYAGGNPNLNPTYSWNFDLLGEYFLDEVGVINAGVFYKSITDPIFDDTYQGTINGIPNIEISSPTNGGNAWIGGVEFGITKRFSFLPGFLKYFGTQINATFMNSEMTLGENTNNPNGRKVSTPYQAKELYNLQLFYETGKLNVRAAFNHKGAYAISFDANAKNTDMNDIYYGKYNSLDFSASYKVGTHFTIFSDVNNVLNEPLMYHFGETPNRPKQVEYYGAKFNLGLKYNL
ncbi:TonB-dependent receptor [Flavobacterium sp. 90]|uniref:TonB-dependent receptor n=1 Tax=unclassified Flavobacterium TaxID=196869 RepID=UPI000EB00039|nr:MULTISPECIES: TonB-dependent receptor [unclassified Flavobacterium]RKR04827.1 TonB-dependent receptor [Flavobacterium sp. 81]TCK56148.1 TonB-dependent receptor [Flavobacterium sp. 90]